MLLCRKHCRDGGVALQAEEAGLTSAVSHGGNKMQKKMKASLGAGLVLGISVATLGFAQGAQPAVDPLAFRPMPLPAAQPPPQEFKTSGDHYRYLLEQAKGGTKHSAATLPDWEGLWQPGPNTIAQTFLDAGAFSGTGTLRAGGGSVRKGVLTEPYEKQFIARRAEVDKNGQQLYDRLTRCEYPGMPRWVWEPYAKEFVNTPRQTWMLNDFMNESRRIFIDGEHRNIDGKHSATGDSIGFWDNDRLVIWTRWVNPADYTRGAPLTSNQFEAVEVWYEVKGANGAQQLVTQATYYDRVSLVKPVTIVYSHDRRRDLEQMGVRIRNWECSTGSNSYLGPDGTTHVYLPGDPEYKDVRGTTDFPDLPGQSLDPYSEFPPEEAAR